jgi:hypothetical protein
MQKCATVTFQEKAPEMLHTPDHLLCTKSGSLLV